MYIVVYLLSSVWLICDPMDSIWPDSSVHRSSQARIMECFAISFSRGLSRISCIGGGFSITEPARKPLNDLWLT